MYHISALAKKHLKICIVTWNCENRKKLEEMTCNMKIWKQLKNTHEAKKANEKRENIKRMSKMTVSEEKRNIEEIGSNVRNRNQWREKWHRSWRCNQNGSEESLKKWKLMWNAARKLSAWPRRRRAAFWPRLFWKLKKAYRSLTRNEEEEKAENMTKKKAVKAASA